ncbi:MAG: helix-hairpin-helix domain-containing protein, partial [Anaerolineales bacterium]
EWMVDYLFWRDGRRQAEESDIELRQSLATAQERARALEQEVTQCEQQAEQLAAQHEKVQMCRSALAVAEDEIEELKASLAAVKSEEAVSAFGATSFGARSAPVEPDELRKIEGIGPKIAETLNEHGILTFEQLAETEVARLEEILEEAGPRFRIAAPETWPEQAALAAAGDWEGLQALQDELVGGRRPTS